MNIVYLGSGAFGIPSLDAVIASKHNLSFIVTQPARPAGRGRKTKPTPVAVWANEHSIESIETANIADPSVIRQIADYKPDLILVISFGQKICDELINLPPKGMINVHGSLLPKYRGAAPINWAIVNGETVTGATIATVTKNWDAGKILAKAETPITLMDTADEVSRKIADAAAGALIDTIDKIEQGTAAYTQQNPSEVTFAPKMKKTDSFIDFNAPAEQIHNKIRGFWPWPGACADFLSKKTGKTQRVTFALTEPVESSEKNLTIGSLNGIMNVVCQTGTLKILKIKPAGRNVMTFRDFVNGYRVGQGDLFLKIKK